MEPKEWSLLVWLMIITTTWLLGDTTFLQLNGGGHAYSCSISSVVSTEKLMLCQVILALI